MLNILKKILINNQMSYQSKISQLVDLLGKNYLIENLERLFDIKYKKCNENNEENGPKPIFETNYENNLDNTIKTVNNSIELKAIDHIYVCSLVLEIVNSNYKQLLLEKAEYILIQKGKFPLIKIVNNKKNESGIYISCDIQYLQSYLENEYDERCKKYNNNMFFFATFGIIVTVFAFKNLF